MRYHVQNVHALGESFVDENLLVRDLLDYPLRLAHLRTAGKIMQHSVVVVALDIPDA